MTSSAPPALAPVGVRGMKVLERAKFSRKIQVPVIKVKNENLAKISQVCRFFYLKLEHFKPVQNTEDKDYKKVFFFNPESITKWEDIGEKECATLNEQGITESNFSFQEVQLSYNNWSYDTIFKAVLPENEETVSGFSQIGHIIHLNLRDELLEYQSLIGEVLVDKIKTCRTVVNKSNVIDNTYRNLSMEVIAGEKDFLVTVIENNCRFKFDFSKVYWNPRLGKEHERILSYLKPNDILFDIFSGVGPFSIPAAKRQCKVFANDLNPDSFKWLEFNSKNNKIKKNLLKCYNSDGKDFICDIFKNYLIEYCDGKENIDTGSKIHVTMNLPALAVEFLKYFKGLIKDKNLIDKLNCEIIVHVYCFVCEDHIKAAKELVNKNFGCDMSQYIQDVFSVRKVSPKKEMMRVTFRLTKEILFDTYDANGEPPTKKLCVEQ